MTRPDRLSFQENKKQATLCSGGLIEPITTNQRVINAVSPDIRIIYGSVGTSYFQRSNPLVLHCTESGTINITSTITSMKRGWEAGFLASSFPNSHHPGRPTAISQASLTPASLYEIMVARKIHLKNVKQA